MKKRIAVYLVFLLAWTIPCFGQFGKLFTVDKELPNSMVNTVFQDKKGIIWIATENGLSSFDGEKFKLFKHDASNESSILNNHIKTFYEASDEQLFIGYITGLQIYDRSTNRFNKCEIITSDGKPQQNHVTCFTKRKNGDILIGTSGNGVFCIKGNSPKKEAAYKIELPYNPSYINFMYEDQNGCMWIGTYDKGLIQINGKRAYLHFRHESTQLTAIVSDHRKRLYVGLSDIGMYEFNSVTGSFTLLPATKGMSIKSMCMKAGGQILFGTEGKGVWGYNPATKTIRQEDFNVLEFDVSKSKVYSIIEDLKGNIWLGIYQKGVVMIPPRTNDFKYIGYKSKNHNMIGQGCIMSVFSDGEGTLWVGTDNDGIYKVVNGMSSSTHIFLKNNTGNNHSPTTIMCLYKDSRGTIWAGSYMGGGLYKIDSHSGSYTRVELKTNSNTSVQNVHSIVEDHNQRLWIATMGTDLFSLDLKTGKVKCYPHDDLYKEYANSLHNPWINCLKVTSDNKLFIGTFDGLGCLDLRTESFLSTYKVKRVLPFNIIYSIFEDKKHTLWVGTSEGLFQLDGRGSAIKTKQYTESNGLSDNTVYGIESDGHYLWLSTNYGISRFNPRNNSFVNFYANDGLQGNEFSKNAVTKDKNGTIYFGGVNGITYFEPKKIDIVKSDSIKVVITDFYIHDRTVTKGMKSGRHRIIDSPVSEADQFNLSANDNSFSIEFSAMEFNKNEHLFYLYSLDNKKWIKLKPGFNNVSFSNLRHGFYTFYFRAQYYNTLSEVRCIGIKIYAPWYLSTVAYIFYVLLFITGLFGISYQIRNRNRIRQQRLEEAHAKEISETKLQLFINISHEIRTPMTVIMNMLDKLLADDSDKARDQIYLSIYRNAERILNLTNQMIDIRKIEKGHLEVKFKETDLVAYIEDLSTYFTYQFEMKQIAFNINTSDKEMHVWVDPLNFDKIIMNLLSNAIKFTPEKGTISINIQCVKDVDKPHCRIEVIDSGIGIEDDKLNLIFDRFYQVSSRSGNGTGVGLHLVKLLMNLHYGDVYAENRTDGPGCRFILKLPLGCDHLKPEQFDHADYSTNKTALTDKSFSRENIFPEQVQSKSKTHVLIVDDDDEIRSFLSEELGKRWHIHACSNGKEALSYTSKHLPDLVISDVMMPDMDGMTLCKKIKSNIHTNKIPVILLTAKIGEDSTIEGLSIGADAYITKPFSIHIVSETVQNLLNSRETLRKAYSGSQNQQAHIDKQELKSPDEKLLARIMAVINLHISDPAFSVEQLAEEVGISRVHLHRKLKELTNQTTRDFIRNVRLQQAAELLKGKRQNITEVANMVGIENISYFSTAFKEMFGVSPSVYE